MVQQRKRGAPELKAEREVQALKLRQQGLPYRKIGERLGCGGATALRYVRDSLERLAKENEAEAKMLRTLELSRLDALYLAAHEVLDGAHYQTSAGQVIEHNGAELRDTGPVLRAIDRLVRISERRCALLGLDAKPDNTGAAAEIAEALKEFAARVPV